MKKPEPCPQCGSLNTRKVSDIYEHNQNKLAVMTLLGYDPDEYDSARLLGEVGVMISGYELKEQKDVASRLAADKVAPPEKPDTAMPSGLIAVIIIGGIVSAWSVIIAFFLLAMGKCGLCLPVFLVGSGAFTSCLVLFVRHMAHIRAILTSYNKRMSVWNREYLCNECEGIFVI